MKHKGLIHKPCNQLTETEKGIVAAWIDTEGTIYVQTGSGTRIKSKRSLVRISINQCDRRPLDWIQKVTGIGTVRLRADMSPLQRKPIFHWITMGPAAVELLEQLEGWFMVKDAEVEDVFYQIEQQEVMGGESKVPA